MLQLDDEHGGDEKLICVPDDKTFPYYSNATEREHLPDIVFQQIEHFFTHCKDLEPEKWVRVGKWGGAAEARHGAESHRAGGIEALNGGPLTLPASAAHPSVGKERRCHWL